MVSSFGESLEVSHERRIEQIKKECNNVNIQFSNVESITLTEVSSVKSSVGSAVTSLVGGKAEYDFLQVYTFSQNGRNQYYLQPFSGLTPLPGQHFMVIPVSLKNPIQYRIKKKQTFKESMYQDFMNRIPFISDKKIRVCEWLCLDSEVEKNLKGIKLTVLREISHVWQNGLTKIELGWTVQACPINNEHTLVSMQTGRYGALGEKSGLKQFEEICSFVSQYASNYSGDGTNNVLISNSYLSSYFAVKILGDEQEAKFSGIQEWVPNNIVKAIVSNLIKFERHKKVYLKDSIDEKKVKQLEGGILKKFNVDFSEVVAAVSMDTFGSLKQVAVFTKDKLYISDLDYELSLDLNDVRGCVGLKGLLDSNLELISAEGDIIQVKVSIAGDFMNDFFKELCKINR